VDVEFHLRTVLYGRVGIERDIGKIAYTMTFYRCCGGSQLGKVSFEVFDHNFPMIND
jgi:hypothetical protein